jgi:hypothetical protein
MAMAASLSKQTWRLAALFVLLLQPRKGWKTVTCCGLQMNELFRPAKL